MSDSSINKHLTYFKVENFKCFESFEMDDIGQFNLIVGDNNVGKTSVLEALLFDEDVSALNKSFQEIIRSRNNYGDNSHIFDISNFIFSWNSQQKKINYTIELSGKIKNNYELFFKKIRELSEPELSLLKTDPFIALTQIQGEAINLDDWALVWKVNQTLKKVITNRHFTQRADEYIPIIYLKSIYDEYLAKMFSYQLKDNKNLTKSLVQNLNLLINGVENITTNNAMIPGTTLVMLDLKQISNQVPLSSQGEGGIKFLRILLDMMENKNMRLMIDEIDSGIHFSRMKEFLKAILQTANSSENNTQLFMTTHSQECIKYFKEALEELGKEYQDKARHFLLKKDKLGNTFSKNFSYAELEHAVENENEIRR